MITRGSFLKALAGLPFVSGLLGASQPLPLISDGTNTALATKPRALLELSDYVTYDSDMRLVKADPLDEGSYGTFLGQVVTTRWPEMTYVVRVCSSLEIELLSAGRSQIPHNVSWPTMLVEVKI